MITTLTAATLAKQKVFAFQRVRHKIFQDKAQLYLVDGGDILANSDHPYFGELEEQFNSK